MQPAALLSEPVIFRVELGKALFGDVLVVHLGLDRFEPGVDCVEVQPLVIREGELGQHDPIEACGRVIGVGTRDGANPGQTGFLADALGLRLHLLAAEALRNFRVDPAISSVAEQVTIDRTAGGNIIRLPNQQRDGIIGFHRLIGNGPPDCVGIDIAVVAVAVVDEELLFAVLSRCIGLGEVEGEFTCCKRVEDRICEVCQAQPLLDEATGLPEPLCDRIDVAIHPKEVLEGPALFGRGHLLGHVSTVL